MKKIGILVVFFLVISPVKISFAEKPNLMLPFLAGETQSVSRSYGNVTHVGHDYYAIDFNIPDDCGNATLATAPGRVETHYGENGGYGNYVDIYHGDKYVTRYAHLESISVYNNQWVFQGQEIGRRGTTGNSTGCHLHFVLYYDGNKCKPEPMGGYTNFVSGGWYTSSNNGYAQMQDWDNTCKNIDPHPLVERFRNSSTGKIEVNATPTDNRIYYYSDYLCQINYYPAYDIWTGEGGAYLEEDEHDSGGGSTPTPDPIPDPADCELSLDTDPFVNGTELHIQNGDTELPANGIVTWKAQLEMRDQDAENCKTSSAQDHKTVETDFYISINGGGWQRICHESTKFSNLQENQTHTETCNISLPGVGVMVRFKTIADANEELIGTPNGGTVSRIEEFEVVGNNQPQPSTPEFAWNSAGPISGIGMCADFGNSRS